MTPSFISRRIVKDRLALIDQELHLIRSLPLADRQAFFADVRNARTAESCLRYALEALFDIGRHILAKGFGKGAEMHTDCPDRYKNLCASVYICGQRVSPPRIAAIAASTSCRSGSTTSGACAASSSTL